LFACSVWLSTIALCWFLRFSIFYFSFLSLFLLFSFLSWIC
jgi:hypothetical protein